MNTVVIFINHFCEHFTIPELKRKLWSLYIRKPVLKCMIYAREHVFFLSRHDIGSSEICAL
jgi:hypothetical protein